MESGQTTCTDARNPRSIARILQTGRIIARSAEKLLDVLSFSATKSQTAMGESAIQPDADIYHDTRAIPKGAIDF